jgi:phage protein D
MVASPEANLGQSIYAKVLVNGKEIPEPQRLLVVDVWLAVNKVAMARVEIADGTDNNASFPISASSHFVPGNNLEIYLGYDNQKSPIFSGVITTLGLEADSDLAPRLIVEAADKAKILTLGRQIRININRSDSELMEALIRGHGLQADVSTTNVKHACLVQYACSDWDLLLLRAEFNGMVVTNTAGKIKVAPPNTNAPPQLNLVYGKSIRYANLSVDASHQFPPAALRSRAWDPSSQALVESPTPHVDVKEPGNLSSEHLAKVFHVSAALQQSPGNLPAADLSSWSQSALLRLRLAKVRGQLCCEGSYAPQPAGMVSLAGFGERFDGSAFISAVQHHVEPGDWITYLDIGLSPEPFAAVTPHISPPAASGQLAAVSHLQVGIVDRPHQDPQGQMRVPVRLPLAPPDSPPIWARLSAPYATDKSGFQFWPEQGDEVIVAFMDNDPRFPVVLGSLYSTKKIPPENFTPGSEIKSIVSRSQLRIKFEEKERVLEISTPGNRMIRLDDHNGLISISDSYGNKINLEESGIQIYSKGKITLNADRDIDLDAGDALSIHARLTADLNSNKVTINTEAAFSATSQGPASLSSTANLSLRGAFVSIN